MSDKGDVDLTGAKQNTGVWLVKVSDLNSSMMNCFVQPVFSLYNITPGSVVYMVCLVIIKTMLNMGIGLKLCLHKLHKGPKVFVTAMGQSHRERRSWKAPNMQESRQSRGVFHTQ